MKTTLLLLTLSVSLFAAAPKEGGVCFRFDDNKPEQQWIEMGRVFEENGARFGMSIVPQQWWTPSYTAMLRDMQKRGFEIMDHTPSHALFSCYLDKNELENLRKMQSFDHADAKRVYFKYAFNPDYPGIPFTGDIQGKEISVTQIAPNQLRYLKSNNFVYDPAEKKAYRYTLKDNTLTLNSFWNENNVNLPERKNVKLEIIPNQGGFLVPEDVLKYHVETSQKRFRAAGIELPVTYIQPGGPEPVPDAKNIGALYSKYGYTGGATYPRSAMRSYNEPNPERQKFAMMWGQFNLEQKDISKVRSQIANAVAKHQVVIGSSHMSVNNVPGGWTEFLKRHDEVLKWCKAKNIPVRLQKEWCNQLYYEKPDPKYNIMPSLTVDRDEDGIPDGYELSKTVKVANGVMTVLKDGKCFEINGLCGAERGQNEFSFEYDASAPATLIIKIDAINWRKSLKHSQVEAKLESGKKKFQAFFEFPQDATFLKIEVSAKQISTPVTISNLSITGK